MKTKYTKELLAPIVSESRSFQQVLARLGLSLTGGNQSHIKKIISFHKLDTSHFTGQGWSAKRRAKNRKSPAEYLIEYDKSKGVSVDGIKKKMFRDAVKEKRCEECGGSLWGGIDIPLELHHLDGNKWNNRIENLKILCPNCHAITENYSGKKR